MSFRYYHADRIRGRLTEFKGTDEELQEAIENIGLLYSSAIKELETRLKILSDCIDRMYSYKPIHHVQSRLKDFESIMEKASRHGIEDPINNLSDVKREVLDIAGIRVICNYEEDLQTLSGLLLAQEDIEMIKVRDYCNKPKESGYRSLHVVVTVPVYLMNEKKMVPVEIQFRSVLMDAWACLEHELRYKNKGELDQETVAILKDCADNIHKEDVRMSKVHQKVLGKENKYSDY